MIWYDPIWYDMIWYDMIWYDMIWYDMIWYHMIWFDTICYDMIWYCASRSYLEVWPWEEQKTLDFGVKFNFSKFRMEHVMHDFLAITENQKKKSEKF